MQTVESQQMQCMEVWGGSQLTARGVAFGGLDAWVYSKPFGDAEHGGDVYYASSCATGRITRLLLADVSGHGSSVAATAADLRTLMRRFVNCLDQADFVRHLNKQFTSLSEAGTFATAIVATFFAPSRCLTFCNAGHPSPLLYRAAQSRWELLGHDSRTARSAPSNIPLGMLDMSEYDQFAVDLEPGDCVLTYTDALMESDDADGKMLGESGVLRIAQLLGCPEPRALAEGLIRDIASRRPGNLADDDVTVMIFRANTKRLRFSLGDKLQALGRLIRAALSPRGEAAPFPDVNLANLGGYFIPALARRWRASRMNLSHRSD